MDKLCRICRLPLILTLLFVQGSLDLLGRDRQGADIVVLMANGHESRGELIAVRGDSLLLKEQRSGVDVSLKVADIDTVKIVNRPQTLKWGLLGAAACGIAFPAAHYYIFAKEEAYTASDLVSKQATESIVPAAIIGVAFGALVGAGIGISKGKDEVFPLATDPLMRVVYLQRLRFLARIRNSD